MYDFKDDKEIRLRCLELAVSSKGIEDTAEDVWFIAAIFWEFVLAYQFDINNIHKPIKPTKLNGP